jgi:hypothetical protein
VAHPEVRYAEHIVPLYLENGITTRIGLMQNPLTQEPGTVRVASYESGYRKPPQDRRIGRLVKMLTEDERAVVDASNLRRRIASRRYETGSKIRLQRQLRLVSLR